MDNAANLPVPEALQPFMPYIEGALLALVIVFIGSIVANWAQKLAMAFVTKRELDPSVGRFLASLIRYAVLAAAILGALEAVGVPTTSFIALVGSAGIAIGLALQGNLSNFASGVLILWFKPFVVGDVVTVGGNTGKVTGIDLFTTSLVTPDNHKIIVPNSSITGNAVTNLTTLGTRRGDISIGVAYGCDLRQVMEVLYKAVRSVDAVLEDPEPSVIFMGFGASSLDFKVYPHANVADWWMMLHEVKLAIYEHLNEAGVEIPFNQIVVHQAEAEGQSAA